MTSDLDIHEFRRDLLTWYAGQKRDLPWRKTRDPYFIWLSEVMLQQTRVDTVIPYYLSFVKAFPTVHHLARASEEAVFKAWQGLGYYRRAKHLHEAAKTVASDHAGRLPRTRQELLKLKGFGVYTSASVASIAFGEPVACVDGNVRRVVSRIFASDDDIDENAQALLEPRDPSSFNQAMMEMGALICLPKNPRCGACPIHPHCAAFKQRSVERYPRPLVKTKVKPVFAYVFVPRWKNRFLLEPCEAGRRFEGLWQFPTLEYENAQTPRALAKDLNSRYGIDSTDWHPMGEFKHQLTHRSYRVFTALVPLARKIPAQKGAWFTASESEKKPLSRLQQKVAEKLLKKEV